MVVHVELNSWRQAEEHFRNLDQDQGRKHYDREERGCSCHGSIRPTPIEPPGRLLCGEANTLALSLADTTQRFRELHLVKSRGRCRCALRSKGTQGLPG